MARLLPGAPLELEELELLEEVLDDALLELEDELFELEDELLELDDELLELDDELLELDSSPPSVAPHAAKVPTSTAMQP